MSVIDSQIALGIIGCGRATQELHLPALQTVTALRVVALADLNGGKLEQTANRFGIQRRYSDPAELLRAPELDAVAVCTPVASHAELALSALAAGKHVLVEKPLAMTVAEGERLVTAAQGTEKITALGFNLRCHRLLRRAREMIAAGSLGQIHQIVSAWGSDVQHDPAMPEWRRSRAQGGGALFEIGVHHIDACAFLLAERIANVQMFIRSGSAEDESVSLLARTDKGVLISSNFSQVTAPLNEFRIIGDEGSISFSLFRADSFVFSDRTRTHRGLRGRVDRMTQLRELPELLRIARKGGDFFMSYGEEWRRFAAAALHGGAPASSFADGLATSKVIEAAVRSLEIEAVIDVAA